MSNDGVCLPLWEGYVTADLHIGADIAHITLTPYPAAAYASAPSSDAADREFAYPNPHARPSAARGRG